VHIGIFPAAFSWVSIGEAKRFGVAIGSADGAKLQGALVGQARAAK